MSSKSRKKIEYRVISTEMLFLTYEELFETINLMAWLNLRERSLFHDSTSIESWLPFEAFTGKVTKAYRSYNHFGTSQLFMEREK